jgi:hypothetical protein
VTSVLDIENVDVYIRRATRDYPIPPLARGMKPIGIHQQLSLTCIVGVMDVKNVRFEDMIARVEQMVMDDRRLTVRQIAANAGISVGSVDTILHDDLKLRKVSAGWVPRGAGSFGLFSHDVWPSVNCRTHERTFCTSITPSLHFPHNC